jgi:hypothetical protein
MEKIMPFDQLDPERWRQKNEEALNSIHDDALTAIIMGVLNLHELEHTGAWKRSGRRFDYSNSTFEVYLHHHSTWSLKDFRFLEEVVFNHFDALKRKGLESVLKRLKRMKNEPNPLAERRRKRRK